MTTPKIEKDEQGRWTLTGVQNRTVDPTMMDYRELRAAANLLPGDTGARARAVLQKNPLASGGILSGLVENGAMPDNKLAQTLIDIDQQTKAKRELDAFQERQKRENEKFKKTLRGKIWRFVKAGTRLAFLPGQTVLEGLNSAARDVANAGEQFLGDVQGAIKGELDWLTFDSKIPGKTREELGYGKAPSPLDPVTSGFDNDDEITAIQIAKDLFAGRQPNLGEGFFVNEEEGAGFRARQAAIKSRGLEVKLGNRTYVRPYSIVDPVTNLITGGNADTGYGTLITALGEVFVAWKADPLIRAGNKMREIRDLQRQMQTSSGQTAARKAVDLANAEAEYAALIKKREDLFAAYKLSPASTADEALKAFDDALQEEMALAGKLDTMADEGYDAGAIANYLSSSKGEAVIDWLADADEYSILMLGKEGTRKTGFTVAQAKALGAAKTRDEVLQALAPYIANGTVLANVLETGTRTGQLLSRLVAGAENIIPNVVKGNASRVLRQMPLVSNIASAYNKVYGAVAKPVDYVRRAYNTVVPGQTMVHYADTDLLVNTIRDYGRIARVSEPTLKNIIVKLINSEDLQTGSFTAVKDLMKEIVRVNSAKKYVDEAELKKVVKVFESAKQDMSKYWTERHAAGAKLEYYFSNGQVKTLTGPHLESELLNSMFYFPDVRELFDIISFTNKFKGMGKVREASDFIVGNIWKKIVLVRPAYIIRNIMEEQIRVFGTGHVSFFNSPVTALAMWLGRDESSVAWRRLLAKLDPFRNTVMDDVSFKLGSANDEFTAEVAAHGNIEPFLTFMQDNTISAIDRDVVRIKDVLGYNDVRYGHERFWEAIANEIRMLRNTAAARTAIINQGTPERAIEFLLRGEGRESWKKFANSKDKEVRDFLLTDEGLMQYLYTGVDKNGRSISLMARIEEVAGNGGPGSQGIKNLIANGEFNTALGSLRMPTVADSAENSIKNSREIAKNRKSLDDINQEFAKELQFYFDGQGSWDNILFKLPVKMTVRQWNSPADIIDSFFNIAVKFEKQTTMGPEWRQKYWDAIYELAPALDEAAVSSLAKVAEKSLSPLVNWTGRPIGREHKVWQAFKSTTGKGTITKEEAHAYASQVASKHVANLFYDASKRRLLYHQLRLILPFGQAWDDTIQAWGRIALDNPDQVYKIGKSLEWLTSPESGALYQLTDARDIYDPNQGFFFNDSQTGQRKLFIPFLGTGLNILSNFAPGGAVPGMGGPFALSATPQSFNFAFASGSVIPGVGPGLTFPVAILDKLGVNPINLLPFGMRDQVNKVLFPFGMPNTEEGAIESLLLSGNWRRIFGGLAGVEASYASSFAPVMSYLITSGDYSLDDPEDQAKLINDTTYFSRWFTIFRGFFGLVSAAPPQLEKLAKDDNGNTILATALYDDFKKFEVESGGNYNKAYGDFIDLYGPQALFSIIGASSGGPTNAFTYEMLQKDPSVLDVYPDVYGFFYPGGGWSQELYNWQRRTGARERMGADEILSRVTSIRYYAALDRMMTRAMQEGWDASRFDEAKANLKDSYVMRGLKQEGDFYKSARQMQQLRQATQDDRFKDSDAVDGLRRYLYFRDKALEAAGKKLTGTLASKGTIAQREWLAERALEIIQDHPEFYKMYYSFFRKELDVE